MADNDSDYHIDEDLEQLFHSDLRNLELGHTETSRDDVVGNHLPEWLVGVIVVIIMLLVAFFVMIITSLVKNRIKKNNRSSTYIRAGSSTSCDDLESGKIGGGDVNGMKMTSFSSVSDVVSAGTVSPSQSSVEPSGQDNITTSSGSVDCIHGTQGCRNPLFEDDEADSDDNNNTANETRTENEEKKDKKNLSSTAFNINAPSTSSRIRGNDGSDHGRSKGMPHKYKVSSASKKALTSTKLTIIHDGDQFVENEGEVRKRIFASKQKSGTHSFHKRERTKRLSTGNVITALDGQQSEEDFERVVDTETGSVSTKYINTEHFKENDTSGCCEDSGVEVASLESQLKDETGGTSESDDADINSVSATTEIIPVECTVDHNTSDVSSNKNQHLSAKDNCISTGNISENNPQLTNTSFQIQPSSCDVDEAAEKIMTTVSEEQENLSIKHSGVTEKSVQLEESIENILPDIETTFTSKPDLSEITTVVSTVSDNDKEETFSCTTSSDIKSLSKTNIEISTKSFVSDNCMSGTEAKPTIQVMMVTALNADIGDATESYEKALSTNL